MVNNTFYAPNDYRSYLMHHGVKGMKWGVRRNTNANAKKGFWQRRKENFQNLQRYNELKNEASEKYNLDELRTKAENESMRNEAAKNAIDREMRSIYGENTIRQTSKDYSPYGTKHSDKYQKASADAEKYVKDTFIKKYGDERLKQAKKSEIAYAGLSAVLSLGIAAGAAYAMGKVKR